MVRRERGAVTVLATDPETPPQKRCLRAEMGRESDETGSTGGSGWLESGAFVYLRIMIDEGWLWLWLLL